MEYPRPRSRQNLKPVDSEFASIFGSLPHVSFETEEDRRLEAEAAAEVARLISEDPDLAPRTPNVNPFEATNEPEITTLATKASRRKRTIGADRPNTAPQNKNKSVVPVNSTTGFESHPFSQKEIASSTGFVGIGFHPLTPIEEEHKKPSTALVELQENLTPRTLNLKLLEKEMNNAENERINCIEEIKKSAKEQLEQEINNLEKNYLNDLGQMKEWFESKKNAIESFKTQQEKIVNLASIITKHSQTVSNLTNKFGKDQNYIEDIKAQELVSKEKVMEARENRLITQMQLLDQEKQRLLSKQKNLEDSEERYRKIIEEEKSKVFEEHKNMNELRVSIKHQEREKKQVLALEQHRLSLLEEQIEREEKSVKDEIQSKQKEIEEKENLMEIEKNEAYSQIQFEKNLLSSQISQFENFKKSIPSINADLNKRISICEEKAKQLQVESENLKKAQELLDKDRVMFEKEAKKIHNICTEIDKETEMMMEQRAELEKRKREIEVKRQEALSIISKSRQDKQRVDHLKHSLSQRMRAYESLKSPMKNVEIPKLDVIEQEIEQPIMKYSQRPRSVISRSTFRATEFMKEMEQYSNVRDDIQNYIAFEGARLMNSKLDYETGINRTLQASVHTFHTPTSSNYARSSHSLYLNAGSFSKPGDSEFNFGSSFYKYNFN